MGKKKTKKTRSSIVKYLVSNVDFRNTVDNFNDLDKVKQLKITKIRDTNLKGWQRIFCRRKKTDLTGWHRYHFKYVESNKNKINKTEKAIENEKKSNKDFYKVMGEKLKFELQKDTEEEYKVTNDEVFLINKKSLDIIYSQTNIEETDEHTNKICRLFVHFGGNIENVVLEILDSKTHLKLIQEKHDHYNSLSDIQKNLFNARHILDEKDCVFTNYINETKQKQAEYEKNMPDDVETNNN